VDQLIAGYRRFRARDWVEHREHYRSLNERQTPSTCVISCCDSRVDPMSIFDAMPGDLFVIRNVANLVPPYRVGEGLQGTSTAIEFAVRSLKVGLILVLGHARCGGVQAAINGEGIGDADFLKQWISLFDAAKQRVPAHDATALEHESIRVSLERLMTFPFVAAAVGSGKLRLAGASFSIFDGRLELLDEATGRFSAIE
jgi:carbonic anhydrase